MVPPHRTGPGVRVQVGDQQELLRVGRVRPDVECGANRSAVPLQHALAERVGDPGARQRRGDRPFVLGRARAGTAGSASPAASGPGWRGGPAPVRPGRGLDGRCCRAVPALRRRHTRLLAGLRRAGRPRRCRSAVGPDGFAVTGRRVVPRSGCPRAAELVDDRHSSPIWGEFRQAVEVDPRGRGVASALLLGEHRPHPAVVLGPVAHRVGGADGAWSARTMSAWTPSARTACMRSSAASGSPTSRETARAAPTDLVDAAGDQHTGGGAANGAGQHPADVRLALTGDQCDGHAGQPARREHRCPADRIEASPAKSQR